MYPALASETYLLRKRPLPYLIGGTWAFMVMAFAFVVPYVIYLALDPATNPDRDDLLAVVLPARLDQTALGSYPLFGGAVLLVLGALVTGSEDRWGTWKVRFTQGPSRTAVIGAKFVAAAIATAIIAAVALLGAVVASLTIATIAGEERALPSAGALLASVGAAWLIALAWTAVGMALAVAFKSATTAIAVGLIWTMAFEQLLSGLAGMLSGLEPLRYVLLSSASGSLVGSLGTPLQSAGGTPGVVDYLSGAQAIGVLLAYTGVAFVVSRRLLTRRDIA